MSEQNFDEIPSEDLIAMALNDLAESPPDDQEPPLEADEMPPEPMESDWEGGLDGMEGLQALDAQEALPEGQDPSPFDLTDRSSISLVLEELDPSRRPLQRTVCEICPNSVWFSSPTEVKCYCRVLYLNSWTSKEPNQITACDGLFITEE